MKVSDLTGPLLDLWVAKAEGKQDARISGGVCRYADIGVSKLYSPSTDWLQGGPLMEREGIAPYPEYDDYKMPWSARKSKRNTLDYFGDTPLIAICRCYVASKFGEDVPDE